MVAFDGYLHLDSCPSTQDRIKSAPGSGWFLIWADRQTRGRGRRDRGWVSREGGLYYSLRYPETDLDAPVTLQLMGAASTWIDLLAEELPAPADLSLKWPNDLLLNGRKLGGFLGEKSDGFVYLGIGINVNNPLPGDENYRIPPESLRSHTGRTHSRSDLLFDWLDRYRSLAEQPDPPAMRAERLEAHLEFLGEPVRVGDARGVARGLAPDGGLILESGESRTTVRSGGPMEVLER